VSALVGGLLMQTVFSLVPNNWAEEVAWMGFVQPRPRRTTPMRRGTDRPAVGLLHAAGNGVAAGSGFGAGFLARLYPDQPFVSLSHLLALAVIAITRARLGASHRRSEPVTDPMPVTGGRPGGVPSTAHGSTLRG